MEFKQIQELLKTVNKSNISEVSIKNGDFEIKIKQKSAQAETQIVTVQGQHPQPEMIAPQQPVVQSTTPQQAEVQDTGESNLITIKSPMIGTFYRSSAPDKPPFVSVGDTIKVGDVVCIVEAMKLFNEIESEVSGKIVKVLIDDANPIEYDQPLFLVEPI